MDLDEAMRQFAAAYKAGDPATMSALYRQLVSNGELHDARLAKIRKDHSGLSAAFTALLFRDESSHLALLVHKCEIDSLKRRIETLEQR